MINRLQSLLRKSYFSYTSPPCLCGNRLKVSHLALLGFWLALICLLSPLPVLAQACGATWTRQIPNDLRDIAQGTLTVAVGANATIITSNDQGSTWTLRQAPASVSNVTLNGVATGYPDGQLYVAVGAGGVILTSPDGITWTPRTSNTTQPLYKVRWVGQFVAVGGAGAILTSPDGITWTPRTSGTSNDLLHIASNMNLVVVGQAGTILTSSNGGSTWIPAASVPPMTSTLYGITPAGFSGFIAVGAEGTILESSNGSNWAPPPSPPVPPITADLFSVTTTTGTMGTGYRAVGTNGTIVTYTYDSMSMMWRWQVEFPPTSKTLYSDLGGIIVGAEGIVLTQPTPPMWTAKPYSGTTNNLNSIAWNGFNFMAVGDLDMYGATQKFTMIESGCGATQDTSCNYWKARENYGSTTPKGDLHGVAWDGVSFTSVGAKGNILSSNPYPRPDCLPYPDDASTLVLYEIAYANDGHSPIGEAVVVGKSGSLGSLVSLGMVNGCSGHGAPVYGEPPREFRRLFVVSHAAMADSARLR